MGKHPFYGVDIVDLSRKTKLRPFIQQITKINMGGTNYPKFLVAHFVGAKGQAKDNTNYFEYVYRESSAHLFIDDNETRQAVPFNRVAWHIGDGSYPGRGGAYNGYRIAGMATNNNSIGVEGCQDVTTGADVWHWQFSLKTYVQMILTFIHLQEVYNIPDSRVIRHFDASEKLCPGIWQYDNWARWWQFKKDIVDVRNALKGKAPIDVTRPDTSTDDGKLPVTGMYSIKTGDTLGKIAKAHSVTVAQLQEWNGIKNANLIFPETKIFVTKPDAAKPVTPPNKIMQLGKEVPASGWYQFTEVVNVRKQDGAYGPVLAQYKPGDKVKYDKVTLAGGFIWLEYTRNVGGKGYVAAGTPSVPYGKFI